MTDTITTWQERDYIVNDDESRHEAMQNEIDELRAALAQQVEQGWQPIETAPKDGTEVIAGHPDGSIDVVSWIEVKNNRRGWNAGACFALSWPTHWMPLPSPPKETTCKQKQ